jgi:hypothetical protein
MKFVNFATTVILCGLFFFMGLSFGESNIDGLTGGSLADLAAQQSMARSARWAVVLSYASLGIAIIGLIYIRFTFEETRKTTKAALESTKIAERAAKETREAWTSEQRAWLSFTNIEKTSLEIFSDNKKIDIVLDFKVSIFNSGNSPATGAFMISKAGNGWTDPDFRKSMNRLSEQLSAEQFDENEEGGLIIAPGGTKTLQRQTTLTLDDDAPLIVALGLIVQYRVFNEKTPRITEERFTISPALVQDQRINFHRKSFRA